MNKLGDTEVNYAKTEFLVADDKAFIRNLVQSMLVKLRAAAVFHAASGQEAIALLERRGNRINCIISDWNMGPIGGLELLRSVRTGQIQNLSPATCFIMLTGNASAAVVTPALALDVNAYLVKPVSFEKLVKTINLAMTKEWQPQQPEKYEAIGGLEVPPDVKESSTRGSASVLWGTRSPLWKPYEAPQEGVHRTPAVIEPDKANDAPVIRNVRLRPVEKIRVGKVLAENVMGNDGALLVATGTVLSEELLSRLKAFAATRDENVRLLVGDA